MAEILKLANHEENFYNVLLAVTFNPETKKILITKREGNNSGINWCFPGGVLDYEENPEEKLKEKIIEKTGYEIENLGSILTEKHPERKNFLSIYYLCEVKSGNEKPGGDILEIKWVSPDEVEKIFEKELHPSLKEYLQNLK